MLSGSAISGTRHVRSQLERMVDGVLALQAAGRDPARGGLLLYWPQVASNPFHGTLYARGFDNDWAVLPLDEVGGPLGQAGVPVTVHIHWIHRLFSRITRRREAVARADAFLDRLAGLQADGTHLVWTVHNLLAHHSDFPGVERDTCARLADLVDSIHVMNPDTVALAASHYQLPAHKVFHVPHPAYGPVYGAYMGRAQARLDLGLRPADVAILLFGALLPYKGIRQTIARLDSLQKLARPGGQVRLILAGGRGPDHFMAELEQLTAARSDVSVYAGHVSDQAVQTYFRAADVVACPYPVSLNSGVAMTGVSFGRPVVVPNSLMAVFSGAGAMVQGFDPAAFHSLDGALAQALAAADDSSARGQLQAFVADHDPAHVSDRFFKALAARRHGAAVTA
ncbi:glycosyltransferase [Yunchengibacter salinarum]|uniref:glycosyltransferase n=1 Tax=Yunchengibacter salinarum TaxID=3133399 RepID=UPI0035B58D91